MALIEPIKRELQQEVGILELEDSAGGVVSYRLMQFATISPDLSSCHRSAALGESGRCSTYGGCREGQSLAAIDKCQLLTGLPSIRQLLSGGCIWEYEAVEANHQQGRNPVPRFSSKSDVGASPSCVEAVIAHAVVTAEAA